MNSGGAARRFSISWPVFVSTLLAFCALAASQVMLLRANRRLRVMAATKARQLEPVVGALVPELRGLGAAGHRALVRFGPSAPARTVMIVFSPTCPLCGYTWPSWRELAAHAPPGTRLVAIDLRPDSLAPSYLAGEGWGNAVSFAGGLDPSDVIAYRLGLVPQTIVVGRWGRVRWVWTGELTKERLRACLRSLQ